MSGATASVFDSHLHSTAAPTPQSRRQHLRLISSAPKDAPFFNWDATQDLSPSAVEDYREMFPAFRGLTPAICDLPDAGTWAANLTVGLLEIIFCQRPISQIERWVLPELYKALIRKLAKENIPARRRSPIQVKTYRSCAISERICECCVIVDAFGCHRAISIRLEGHRGRWIATALQIL